MIDKKNLLDACKIWILRIIFTCLLGICFIVQAPVSTKSLPVVNFTISGDKRVEPDKTYLGNYTITAYDLSYQSCQKTPDHPAYGITASGTSLKEHTRESAMAIAVDPNKIPLGSKVLLVFNEKRSKYNGVYKAVDTGGDINNNRIDIFFGDLGSNVSKEALEFGVADAQVYILN